MSPSPEVGNGVALDPVVLLQEKLGIDKAGALALASIKVRCTAPGRTEESSLGDFIASGHGSELGAEGMVDEIAREAALEEVSPLQAFTNIYGKKSVVIDPATREPDRFSREEMSSLQAPGQPGAGEK